MHRVAKINMIALMTERHERLREARENAGYKHASDAAAALGIPPSTYRAHENGQNKFELEEAQVYGKKFDCDPLWLMGADLRTGNGNGIHHASPTQIDIPNATIGAKIVGTGRKIPVYGQAVGGVDGEFLMNGSILYEVMAPPVLSEISDAYAVAIAGDSMSPRYDDGEIAFVDPHRRVKKGDYVIAQIKTDEHDPPHAYVKKFIRHNSVELVLEQFNPPKELRFPASAVHAVHFIVMAGVA